MDFETVNVGSSPNDGEGDSLRSAFLKLNQNMAALAAITASIFNVMDPAYAANGDGTGNDGPAIEACWNACGAAGGGIVEIPRGTYLTTETINLTIKAENYEVWLEDGAVILAAGSLPVDNKLIFIGNDTPAIENVSIRWSGGKIDGRSMPARSTGAPDLLYIPSNEITKLTIDGTYFISNDDYSGTAGDGHIFVAGSQNVTIKRCTFVGAVDAAIYLSGNTDGTSGKNCRIESNYFYQCETCAIPKRFWQSYIAIGNHVENCGNGFATGEADGTGDGLLPGREVIIANNYMKYVGRAINPRWCDNAIITGNRIINFGVSRNGNIVAESAILIDGSSDCTVTANNISCPDITPVSGARGIKIQPRTISGTTRNSTANLVAHNTIDIDVGVCIEETNSSQDANHILFNKTPGSSTTYTLNGPNSVVIKATEANALQFLASAIYLGGDSASASLAVRKVASAVSGFTMDGAISGAGSGTVLGNFSANSTCPITILPKGNAPILLGGGASAEGLRVNKGTSGGNACEIVPAAAGTPPEWRVRGADTDIPFKAVPKGTAPFMVPIGNIPTYADDTAAGSGGLTAGQFYKTSAGALMVKL